MSGMIAVIVPLVVFLGLGWVALLVAAPFLPTVPAAVVYLLGAQICHQIAERSFHLAGAQLPVCARCTGIYAGFAAGAVLATLSRRVRGSDPAFAQGSDPATERHRGRPPAPGDSRWRGARAMVVIGALPTGVTLLAEWAGLWQTSNVARAIAGALLGVAVGLVVLAGVATVHYRECAPRPPIARDRPPSHI